MAKIDLSKVGKNLLKNTDSGEDVEVQSLWGGQTVCRWTAAEVSKLEPDLRASGIALVGIGPEEAGLQEFREGGFFKGALYLDENKKTYKDLGFKRYTALSVVPAALGKKVREVSAKDSPGDFVPLEDISKALGVSTSARKGQTPVASAQGIQGNYSGDLLQSGGMLIVDKGGENVLLHFVQDSPGDFVPLEDISRALGVSTVSYPTMKNTWNKMFLYNNNNNTTAATTTSQPDWSISQ
ncbi:hypothetical protein CRUP_022068, partial [Coryphaenoides rupestris]